MHKHKNQERPSNYKENADSQRGEMDDAHEKIEREVLLYLTMHVYDPKGSGRAGENLSTGSAGSGIRQPHIHPSRTWLISYLFVLLLLLHT